MGKGFPTHPYVFSIYFNSVGPAIFWAPLQSVMPYHEGRPELV